MKVQTSDGRIWDLPEAVATGLVASEDKGFSWPADEPAPEPSPEKPKRGRPRKTKPESEG